MPSGEGRSGCGAAIGEVEVEVGVEVIKTCERDQELRKGRSVMAEQVGLRIRQRSKLGRRSEQFMASDAKQFASSERGISRMTACLYEVNQQFLQPSKHRLTIV
jgi:hypothetical protein